MIEDEFAISIVVKCCTIIACSSQINWHILRSCQTKHDWY